MAQTTRFGSEARSLGHSHAGKQEESSRLYLQSTQLPCQGTVTASIAQMEKNDDQELTFHCDPTESTFFTWLREHLTFLVFLTSLALLLFDGLLLLLPLWKAPGHVHDALFCLYSLGLIYNVCMLMTTKFLSLAKTPTPRLICNCLSYCHLKLSTSCPQQLTTYTPLPLLPTSENGTVVHPVPHAPNLKVSSVCLSYS
uniref:Uncharacterized protein n=1 Tax=Myotis myotis TaxID=51298 RepID=A0A7J7UPL2_MYOMY|nr:hypothetical protein mMyoMyo1_008605 [Myotis myotis]